MRLASTFPEAVSSAARQNAGSPAKTQSDDPGTPFRGVLDQISDEAGHGRGLLDLPDAANAQDGQLNTALLAGATPTPKRGAAPLPTFSFQTDGPAPAPAPGFTPGKAPRFVLADAGAGARVASVVPAAPPVDLASVLATLSPAASADTADGGKSAAAPGSSSSRRGANKSAPASSDPMSATIAPSAPSDAVSLSSLLGLMPPPPQQALGDAPDKGKIGAAADAPKEIAVEAKIPTEHPRPVSSLRTAAAAAAPARPGGKDGKDDGFSATLAPVVKSVMVETQFAPVTTLQPLTAAASAAAPARPGGKDGRDDGFSATLAPVVKSVTVETQFAPVTTLPPMQQVIHALQELADAPASATPAAPPPQAAPLLSSRTMTLVLEPENLGTVTVRMQLRGGSLDLQLDVDNAQTLSLLTKEKDSLSAAMANQDYQVGTLTMRASETQTGSQGSDNGSRPHDQSGGGVLGGDDGAPQGQASHNGGPAGGSRQDARSGRGQAGNEEPALARSPDPASAPGASGLYI